MFLVLQRPRSGILFLPTTSTEKLAAADLAPVASLMAVARWNCRPIVQPVVASAVAATLVNLNLALRLLPGRVALVKVVPCSVQSLVPRVGALLLVWDRFAKRDANRERVASVTLV